MTPDNKQKLRAANITHGMSHTAIYRQWHAMITRCTNPNINNWHRYGGRGITVCDAWRDFTVFFSDMGASWRAGLTIERINNDEGYAPGNCKWATRQEQARNRRRVRLLDTPWGRVTLVEAAERSGICATTIASRIKAKSDPFILHNANLGRKHVSYARSTDRYLDTPWGWMNLADTARRVGITRDALLWRLGKGLSVAEIIGAKA